MRTLGLGCWVAGLLRCASAQRAHGSSGALSSASDVTESPALPSGRRGRAQASAGVGALSVRRPRTPKAAIFASGLGGGHRDTVPGGGSAPPTVLGLGGPRPHPPPQVAPGAMPVMTPRPVGALPVDPVVLSGSSPEDFYGCNENGEFFKIKPEGAPHIQPHPQRSRPSAGPHRCTR